VSSELFYIILCRLYTCRVIARSSARCANIIYHGHRFFLFCPPTLFQQHRQVLIYYNIFFHHSNSKIIISFSIVSHKSYLLYILFDCALITASTRVILYYCYSSANRQILLSLPVRSIRGVNSINLHYYLYLGCVCF